MIHYLPSFALGMLLGMIVMLAIGYAFGGGG